MFYILPLFQVSSVPLVSRLMVSVSYTFRRYVILQSTWYDNAPGPSSIDIVFVSIDYVRIEPNITLLLDHIYIRVVSQN